jgi:hypothetical protein
MKPVRVWPITDLVPCVHQVGVLPVPKRARVSVVTDLIQERFSGFFLGDHEVVSAVSEELDRYGVST